MENRAPSASELILMTDVARRYYLRGHTKSHIARDLRLNRFRISRLLDSARAHQLVHITIDYPDFATDLADLLRARFGLRRVVVASAPDCDSADTDTADPDSADTDLPDPDLPDPDSAGIRRAVGHAAAALLSAELTTTDVLGLGWSHTIDELSPLLATLPAVPIVQLTGAPAQHDASPAARTHTASRFCTGPGFFYQAPLVAPDEAAADVIRSRPDVARVIDLVGSVTTAVLSIGLGSDCRSSVDAAPPRTAGAIADLSGIAISADGHPVTSRSAARLIRTAASDIARIPNVIAVAHRPETAPAVRAVVNSRLVHTLVIDIGLAEALLDE